MSLPPRNRPPPPFPGSPEALKAEEERNRIILASQTGKTTLAVPQATLLPLPELPQSTRLSTIPVAQFDMKTFTGQSGNKYNVHDLENAPASTGNKPSTDVQHQWDDVGGGGAGQQPGWLNSSELVKTCRVCGVTMRADLIRADRRGMNFHYVDAFGTAMTSLVELSCPTFLGDVPGAVAETKGRVRNLDCQMETVHDRLDRLEKDNLYLREQLGAKIQLDVTGLVDWLGQMAQMAAQAGLPMSGVTVAGLPLEVPMPIADLVRGVGEASRATVDIVVEDVAKQYKSADEENDG